MFGSVEREDQVGFICLPFDVESWIFFKVLFVTAIPHCWHIINVKFYVSIVEDFSGIDVNNYVVYVVVGH